METPVVYYKSMSEYAKTNKMDWRTVRNLIKNWTLIFFRIREKPVIIEKKELVRLALS